MVISRAQTMVERRLAYSAPASHPAVTVPLAGLVIVALGTWLGSPVAPWPRFWALAFFIALFWPAALWLAGTLAGRWWQGALAVALLAGTVTQQVARDALPLHDTSRWMARLAEPGEPGSAVRHRIALPAIGDAAWDRAWQRATRAAVLICLGDDAVGAAGGAGAAGALGAVVSVNGGSPVSLASLERRAAWAGASWYVYPITRDALEGRRAVEVEVRRSAAGGQAPQVCAGRDDPRRPGAGSSARWDGAGWSPDLLAGRADHRAPATVSTLRYYVELRLYNAAGEPRAGVWY